MKSHVHERRLCRWAARTDAASSAARTHRIHPKRKSPWCKSACWNKSQGHEGPGLEETRMDKDKRHNLPIPVPDIRDPELLSDQHRPGIYAVQMDIIFPGGTVMRFNDNPAVVCANSGREAKGKFEALCQRDMDNSELIEGTVHPDLKTFRFLAECGDAGYVN